jgi:hypothetical protein
MSFMHIASFRLTLAAVALSASVVSCGSHSTIDKLYQAPGARSAQYQRILVIGIASEPGQRRRIEDLIAAEFDDNEVTAVTGYSQLGPSPVLLQDEIDEAAAATNSDAILITHIVSVTAKPEITKGRVDIKSECRGGNPIDYFLYDHDELREPDSVAIAHEVVIVTNLYDARNGTRMWTIQSTCFEKTNLDPVLWQEARAIVRQLRRDRLIVSTAG